MFYFDTSFLTPLIRVEATTAHIERFVGGPSLLGALALEQGRPLWPCETNMRVCTAANLRRTRFD